MTLSVIFLTFTMETNYLRMYWIEIFTKFSLYVQVQGAWSIRPSFRDRSRDVAAVIEFSRFFARIGENWHTHLHSVHWHSTTDWNIATWMSALTSSMTALRLIKQ